MLVAINHELTDREKDMAQSYQWNWVLRLHPKYLDGVFPQINLIELMHSANEYFDFFRLNFIYRIDSWRGFRVA